MTLDKEISPAEHFRVQGGPILPSALALRAYLRTIPQQQFDAHVGAGKNDFANWIEHVFGETALARRLRSCTTREQMVWELDDAFAESRMALVVAGKDVVRKPMVVVPEGPEITEPVEYEDDGRFNGRKSEIMESNERISAKYDDVIRNMQEALKDPVPSDIEKRSEQLKARHQDIVGRISELRKRGRDALIPALVIRQFMPKLRFAEISREGKDFDAAAAVLDQAEAELKEASEAKDVDVRRDVLALAEAQGKSEKEAKAQ